MARRVLLKLSGEALKGSAAGVFDAEALSQVCQELVDGAQQTQVGVVVGGGNIIRGAPLQAAAADPTRPHYMGMLATLINSLALKEGIISAGGRCQVYAPHAIPNVASQYHREQVVADLDAGTIVVFGGGTGHPFFTTDTTAALRASEMAASVLLKGSNVDGIYSADPRKDPTATRFEHLTFDQALAGRYAVMDQAAFALCREQDIAIRVFDMTSPGAIRAALGDNPPGTVVGHPTP
jgi:uridylate kinase